MCQNTFRFAPGREDQTSISTGTRIRTYRISNIGARNESRYERGSYIHTFISADADHAFQGYFVGPEVPFNPDGYRDFAFPNKWPSASLVDPSIFQEPLLDYRSQLIALSHRLMEILAIGLPFNSDPNLFADFSIDPLAVVRLLHYPPQPDLNDPRQVGAGAHTDFGAITLLMQDSQGGLQVLHGATGTWIDVKPNPDAYVVNIGDMLQKWTDGEYRSNVHRVINKSGGHRYSVPFFFDGNLDYVLRPLNGSDNGQEGVTVEEFMKERYRRTFPDQKK